MNSSTVKYELIWHISILGATVLFLGIITKFQFGEVEIYDSTGNIGVPTFYLLPLIFLWLTLIVIGTREIKYNFNRKTPIIILIVYNILTISFTVFFLFSILVAEVIGEIFSDKGGQIENIIIWGGPVLLLMLIILEVFLIFKIREINRKNKSELNLT